MCSKGSGGANRPVAEHVPDGADALALADQLDGARRTKRTRVAAARLAPAAAGVAVVMVVFLPVRVAPVVCLCCGVGRSSALLGRRAACRSQPQSRPGSRRVRGTEACRPSRVHTSWLAPWRSKRAVAAKASARARVASLRLKHVDPDVVARRALGDRLRELDDLCSDPAVIVIGVADRQPPGDAGLASGPTVALMA
jgi:hypothetical protein